MSRTARVFFGLVLTTALLAGFGCRGVTQDVIDASQPFTLTIWGTFDDEDAYSQIITDYKNAHPYVQIIYKKLRPEEYQNDLVNALAVDRGPDLFMVHNTDIRGSADKIAPLPKTITLAELVLKGTVKKEAAYEIHTKNTLSVRQLQTLYPDQVVKDAVVSVPGQNNVAVDQIEALPLSIDTLALYWNRDLLNAAGIASPPADWTEFQQDVKKMVKLDSTNVVQAGAALGTAKNVARATDILSLVMLQNLTPMVDENGYPAFNQTPQNLSDRTTPPGVEALVFYTDFANSAKDVYTWNDKLPNSLDAFVTGQAAMFLGYNYDLPVIRARAPKLKFGIAPAPQIAGNPQKNFANYWLYTVSKKSKHQAVAWDFIQFMTSAAEAKKYLAATEKPTALRSIIPDQVENGDLGVFANQILTAESWYQGADSAAADAAMADLIDETLAGGKAVDAINTAVQRVQQTIEPKSNE